MEPIEIIVIVVAVAIVVFSIIYNVKKRKRGENSCDCGGSCSYSVHDCGMCDSKKEKIKADKDTTEIN